MGNRPMVAQANIYQQPVDRSVRCSQPANYASHQRHPLNVPPDFASERHGVERLAAAMVPPFSIRNGTHTPETSLKTSLPCADEPQVADSSRAICIPDRDRFLGRLRGFRRPSQANPSRAALDEIKAAVAAPTGQIGHQHVTAKMNFHLHQQLPPAWTAVAVLKGRDQRHRKHRHRVRMPRHRMRADPQITIENLGDQVIRDFAQVLVRHPAAENCGLARHDDDASIVKTALQSALSNSRNLYLSNLSWTCNLQSAIWDVSALYLHV